MQDNSFGRTHPGFKNITTLSPILIKYCESGDRFTAIKTQSFAYINHIAKGGCWNV